MVQTSNLRAIRILLANILLAWNLKTVLVKPYWAELLNWRWNDGNVLAKRLDALQETVKCWPFILGLHLWIRTVFHGLGRSTLSAFNVLCSNIGSLRSLTQFYQSAHMHVPALLHRPGWARCEVSSLKKRGAVSTNQLTIMCVSLLSQLWMQ